MPDLVPVRVRDCACPDFPHADGDTVYLAPKVPLALGIAFGEMLSASLERPEAERLAFIKQGLAEIYVRHGFRGSNFDVTPDDILDDWEIAEPVAERGDELYSEVLTRPLAQSASKPSRGGQTARSTSPRKASRTPSPA